MSVAGFPGESLEREIGRYELPDSGSCRRVEKAPEEFLEELGYEGSYVVKMDEGFPESPVTPHQNRRETRAYLESLESGEEFIAPVVAGSKDFSWILQKEFNEISNPERSSHGRKARRYSPRGQIQETTLPEGWRELDSGTELGTDGNRIVVIDAGQLEKDNWNIHDPLDSDYVETDEEYFWLNK